MTCGRLTQAAAQPEPLVGQDAALLLPNLQETAAALLQQSVSRHFGRERHRRSALTPERRSNPHLLWWDYIAAATAAAGLEIPVILKPPPNQPHTP